MDSRKKGPWLFNCTTNVMGGPLQNAVNFIIESCKDSCREWVYAVSPEVAQELEKFGLNNVGKIFSSPAKSRSARKGLEAFSEQGISLVYTMAGPSYVDFGPTHVMGCSNPYITNLDALALRTGRTIGEIGLTLGRTLYQALHARNADYWIFQTESSRNGFCKRLKVDRGRTYVVPNAVGAAFRKSAGVTRLVGNASLKNAQILCPAAAYPHKWLHRIPEVISDLNTIRRDLKPVFTITGDNSSKIIQRTLAKAKGLGVERQLVSHGAYAYKDAQTMYRAADMVFMPSLLEVFSTSYLEAMAMGRPLVVADREFSREICGDAAEYFSANSVGDAAKALYRLLMDPHLRRQLVAKGERKVEEYGSGKDRYLKICDVLEDCVQEGITR
ncbi:glycosyltransferase [Thioalkalivibrio sp. AKL7]|uniref:glycosyltransferase n=1 Tax=Thioalkalivibrio sp. AKL7 TaxID=1158155 RepID=UPI0009D91E41|nr:glycosyltransferase [Thioalkalivibrio sp. AKL7]